MIYLLMAAYNEEKEIGKTLKRLAELFYQQYIKDLKNGNIKSIEKTINKIK